MNILVQNGIFTEDENNRVATKKALGQYFDVTTVDDESIMLGKFPITPKWKGLFRGSLAMARRLGRKFPHADATKWAPALASQLASEDYFFLDAGSLLKRMENGKLPNTLFIRPCSGFKEFAGAVRTSEALAHELNFMAQNKNIGPEILCLAATPVKVTKEWRFIFAGGRLVGASLYLENGTANFMDIPINDKPHNTPTKLALQLGSHPFFQNIFDFVIDIGMTRKGPRVIEVNAFETASFYGANLEKIYQAWKKSLGVSCSSHNS